MKMIKYRGSLYVQAAAVAKVNGTDLAKLVSKTRALVKEFSTGDHARNPQIAEMRLKAEGRLEVLEALQSAYDWKLFLSNRLHHGG